VTRRHRHQPFPENTHGHLYYCTPQDQPPLSGSVRFRILPSTSDHPKDFAEGIDLLRPNGELWGLSLYSIIREAAYAPLAQKLLDENLLDTGLLNNVAELPKIRIHRSVDYLYTLSDPFTWSLGQPKDIRVITEDHLGKFSFHPFGSQPRKIPFTGILLSNNSMDMSLTFSLSQVLYSQDSKSQTYRNISTSLQWLFASWTSCLLSIVLFRIITSSYRKQAN
jgi:hypothetical protein